MSKRVKNQMIKDRVAESSDEEMPLAPKRASADVLARRPIARMGKRFNKAGNGSNGAPVASGTQNSSSISSAGASSTLNDHQINQIKSLNGNFLKSINDSLKVNPIADLNAVLKKYQDYYSKIINSEIEVKNLDVPKVEVKPVVQADSKPNPFAVFSSFSSTASTPAPAPVANADAPKPTAAPVAAAVAATKEDPIEIDADSESDEEDEEPVKKDVKIQGPSFTLDKVPTSKNYGFKFGYVPPKKADSDSESEVEIKGPTFQLDSKVEIKDSIFKLPKTGLAKADEKKTEEPSKPAFSFGAKPDEKASTPAPAFTFSASTTVQQKDDDVKPTPSFTFGSTNNKTDEKPAFSFGAPATSNEAKPAFSFTAPTMTTEVKKDESKPAFSFTAPATTEEKKTEDAPKPAFSFGAPAAAVTGESNPVSTSTEAKPLFSFKPASTNNNTASAFTFSSSGDAKPAFSFGSSAPSFSFSVPKPQGGEDTAAATSANTNGEAEEEETSKDQVKGNFAIVNLTEKVEVHTGEEDEETLYTKRSKVSQLKADKSGYESKGLGELKVLKNKVTGKSRFLVRSDGSFNVVLNVPISKDIKYEIIGAKNNILKVPVFTESGVETYICQVKTNGDAEELLKSVQNCQQ